MISKPPHVTASERIEALTKKLTLHDMKNSYATDGQSAGRGGSRFLSSALGLSGHVYGPDHSSGPGSLSNARPGPDSQLSDDFAGRSLSVAPDREMDFRSLTKPVGRPLGLGPATSSNTWMHESTPHKGPKRVPQTHIPNETQMRTQPRSQPQTLPQMLTQAHPQTQTLAQTQAQCSSRNFRLSSAGNLRATPATSLSLLRMDRGSEVASEVASSHGASRTLGRPCPRSVFSEGSLSHIHVPLFPRHDTSPLGLPNSTVKSQAPASCIPKRPSPIRRPVGPELSRPPKPKGSGSGAGSTTALNLSFPSRQSSRLAENLQTTASCCESERGSANEARLEEARGEEDDGRLSRLSLQIHELFDTLKNVQETNQSKWRAYDDKLGLIASYLADGEKRRSTGTGEEQCPQLCDDRPAYRDSDAESKMEESMESSREQEPLTSENLAGGEDNQNDTSCHSRVLADRQFSAVAEAVVELQENVREMQEESRQCNVFFAEQISAIRNRQELQHERLSMIENRMDSLVHVTQPKPARELYLEKGKLEEATAMGSLMGMRKLSSPRNSKVSRPYGGYESGDENLREGQRDGGTGSREARETETEMESETARRRRRERDVSGAFVENRLRRIITETCAKLEDLKRVPVE